MGECIYLTDLQLLKDKDNYDVERCYLKAVYEKVTKYKRERITIPRILLPINTGEPIIKKGLSGGIYPDVTVDIGFGDLPVDYVTTEPISRQKGAVITEILEEYPQKMTLEEIEKKLGYKVELVSTK